VRALFIAIVILLSPAARADWDLPAGKYTLTAGGPEVCFEPMPGRRLRLTLKSKSDRDPYVLEGPYVVTALKMADYHASFTVEHILHKTLSKCRKFWYDEDVAETRQLDHTFRRGEPLRLTLVYECANERRAVQLCIHDAGDDHKQVICRELYDWSAPKCKPPPPIDGAQINPAPAPAPR
jgi:hypothetical protein